MDGGSPVRRSPLKLAALALVLSACSDGDPDPAVVARGAEIYQQSCVQCHGGPTGGEISDIPPVHNANGHTWHHADCLLEEIVRDGMEPRQDPDRPVMPAFGERLSNEDINAVLTHIRTWWTEEQQTEQARITSERCN